MTPSRAEAPPDADVTVFVVDDDDAMRQGLAFLVRSAGYEVEAFASAQAFLDRWAPGRRGCLLLDVRMPRMSGLELQQRLCRDGCRLPIIIVTAYADVPMAVRAMHDGAYDFVEKPFEGAELLGRIRGALAREAEVADDAEWRREAVQRLATLTPREREVMALVVDGMLNKQIAAKLDISMKTVENHRAHVMEKMGAVSLAELVRLAIATEQT